jgi:hypothetical protein
LRGNRAISRMIGLATFLRMIYFIGFAPAPELSAYLETPPSPLHPPRP